MLSFRLWHWLSSWKATSVCCLPSPSVKWEYTMHSVQLWDPWGKSLYQWQVLLWSVGHHKPSWDDSHLHWIKCNSCVTTVSYLHVSWHNSKESSWQERTGFFPPSPFYFFYCPLYIFRVNLLLMKFTAQEAWGLYLSTEQKQPWEVAGTFLTNMPQPWLGENPSPLEKDSWSLWLHGVRTN